MLPIPAPDYCGGSASQDGAVLVTGGAGFIGSKLVKVLAGSGAKVAVADQSRVYPASLEEVREQIDYFPIDLRSPDHLEILQPERFSCIFHLAGNSSVAASVKDPWWDFEINLRIFLMLLERLRGARPASTRVIYVSSAAVHGSPTKLPMEESDPFMPLSPYGISKMAGEAYARVYANLFGLRTASARIFSCYGPGQRKLVVYDIITRLLQNPNHLLLRGNGSQRRDFIYVDDVISSFVHISLYAPLAGEAYNIATGSSHSVAEVVDVICRLLNCNPVIEYSGDTRQGEPDVWVASVEKLRKIGFAARFRLEDGLKPTIEWLRSDPELRSKQSAESWQAGDRGEDLCES